MQNPLSSEKDVRDICNILEIEFEKVTNFIHFGSRVQGSASVNSDYDVVIVGDIYEDDIDFRKDNYFYNFEMKKVTLLDDSGNDKSYDIIVHSNKNFEELLFQRHFIIFVESLFSDITLFHPVYKVDYKRLFLENYMSKQKLYHSLHCEWNYAMGVHSLMKRGRVTDTKWVLKKLYNTWRYHDTIFELIDTGNITSLSRCNNLKKEIFEDFDRNPRLTVSKMRQKLMSTYYDKLYKD
jgi:predicted nucleotidyltransferase